MSAPFEIDRMEASYWWRTNVVLGSILHRLMLVFIAVPLVLVAQSHFVLSVLVFLGMIPYGVFLRYLAERSLLNFVEKNPESIDEFVESGVITL